MVSLRANIRDAEEHGIRDLTFDGEVILLGVLSLQVRIEFAEKKNRTERGPIHAAWGTTGAGARSRGRLVDDAVERVGRERTSRGITRLRKEREVKVGEADERAAPERRLGAELFEHELLHRIVEKAEAGADAGIAGATEELSQPAFGERGAPRQTDAWGEPLDRVGSQTARHSWISR